MEQTRHVKALDQVADLLTENAHLRARIAELESMVVWAARAGVWFGSNMMRGYLLHTFAFDEDGDLCGDDRIYCDGTDADILRAVREAKG